jgi:putative hydrolase of the HAD superfamily
MISPRVVVPSAVVFDLGKVLLDFDYQIAAQSFAKACGNGAPCLADLLLRTPLLLDYETGRLTTQVFFDTVCSKTGYPGTLREFAKLFGDIFTPIEPMIRLQGELRRRGVPTFVFSNTNELAIEHIRTTYPFFSGFDGYVLSYERGYMKPDTRIYRVVERMCSQQGPDILYIDDRLENVDAGASLAWQVIAHQTPEFTIQRVRQLGLLEPKVRRF